MWPRGWSNACISRTRKNLPRQALVCGVKKFPIISRCSTFTFLCSKHLFSEPRGWHRWRAIGALDESGVAELGRRH